ncbi:hypothetical protein [Streptomyces toxytricini]|uniref:hypothetical protein n=1 Tax=Streptomyces toxytricini TaxID=67369 RepID=UPI003426F653
MSDVLAPGGAGDDGGGRGSGSRGSRTRKAAELAAVLSATTALAALVLGLMGLLNPGDAQGGRRAAGAGGTGAAAPPAETPSAVPTGPTPGGAATPAAAGTSASAPAPPSARPTAPPSDPPPPVPAGWHRVTAKALTLSLAVPDGWKLDTDTALQANWVSPDGRYVIGVKRDGSNGHTAQSAAIGQLAWYRKAEESKMQGLTAATHADRQGGKDAVRLELDYRWPERSTPCHRTEVFVAGTDNQVYQLLVNDQEYDPRASELPQLLKTARDHLRTDTAG